MNELQKWICVNHVTYFKNCVTAIALSSCTFILQDLFTN